MPPWKKAFWTRIKKDMNKKIEFFIEFLRGKLNELTHLHVNHAFESILIAGF